MNSVTRSDQTPLVLHVPYTFFPDPSGGTEVYVEGLARRLSARGWLSAVAAPATAIRQYVHDGLNVYRFATDPRPRLDFAYGVPDEIAAGNFRAIVEKLRPHIVHLHARTAAVSERLIDAARSIGAAVVFTYHTPTVSCARGTMMLFGERPCDGTIQVQRCTACALAGLGAPKPLARMATNLLSGRKSLAADRGGPSFLRVPGLIAGSGERFAALIGKTDHVVAVCEWVRDVLVRNGVPSDKITLSRQGLSQLSTDAHTRATPETHESLRIAYFGRIDRAKGPDLLARALKLIPDAPVTIDIFAIRQAVGFDSDYAWLKAAADSDKRLSIRAAVRPDRVIGAMAEYDLIAIPSRWLETGPLVVLEAFAAGVPVLGASLGGIAELVRDGVDGALVAPDDPAAWAAAIANLARNPDLIGAMQHNITAPRSMDSVVDEMISLYGRIAGNASTV